MGQLRMKVWVEVIGTDGVPQRREIATVDRSFRRIKPVGRIGNVTTAAGFTGFMAIDLVRSIRSLVVVACGSLGSEAVVTWHLMRFFLKVCG